MTSNYIARILPKAVPLPALIVMAACILLGAAVGQAKLVTVVPVPTSFPDEMPWGEIVREIRVEGNKYTRESIIRMAIRSEIGQPYVKENARLDLLWVSRLGAFTAVTFTTEPVSDGIALIVTVQEASPYIPSLSIALTQENGLEIGPSFSSSNLFGIAARASAYARFGGATNIGIRFTDPQLPVRSFAYGYSVQYFHRERTNELLGFQETSDEVFLEIKKPTTQTMRTGLRFRYLGLGSDQPGVTLNPDNRDNVPSLGIFVQHDSRNGLYPTGGWFIDVEGGRYGIFGGDSDFWRLDLDARCYFPAPLLGERHSFTISTLVSLQNGVVGETIPEYQEFFIGGTNSVRGWSMGSRVGQHQWLSTMEYWYRLMEQKIWKFWFVKWRMGLQLGLFGDLGTAWSEPEELEGNMIGGYGAGFRLTLPVITMVRFDLAYGESGPSVRMFIGGGEKAIAQKQRVR